MDHFRRNTSMLKLSDKTLAHLPDRVTGFQYDRSLLTAGILQIGVGNFHRAHQAWYLHRLFEKEHDLDWAIVGSGVRPFDKAQRQKLAKQDFLTTLIELDPSGSSAEVIGSMIDYVPVKGNNRALVDRMAAPDIRIVMLTVTEGGYFIDPVTMGFDASHPDIRHDVENPHSPKTAFGAMVEALRIRRDRGYGPFTGLCCDNLKGNGTILRQTVVSLTSLIDRGLAHWIDTECSFPNSMVDCIVPSTGPKELALAQDFGIDDAVPVTHENFRQWVIEDRFCAGRPDLEKVGVTFTDDVHGYEDMKIRVLNGGHQVIANVGEILSLETIADCMVHPKVGKLFSKITRDEIAPHVDAVPDMTPNAYIDLIEGRFSNSKIVDTTRRVAFDGSSRHPGFVIPSIHDALRTGSSISGLALVEAAWARMCEGTRENGTTIAPNDPHWEELQKAAQNARVDPLVWLAQTKYYGDLAQNPRFSSAFSFWLKMIWEEGTEAAVGSYLVD